MATLHISVADGMVKFPYCVIERQDKNYDEYDIFVHDALELFHRESNNKKIICYSSDEKDQVIKILNSFNINHTIEYFNYSATLKKKTQGIKYASRSEAIKHIEEDAEPKSQIIPNLEKRLQASEAKSALIPDLIARLESAEKELKAVKGIVAIK